jgi:hypothetical protein
MLAAVAYAPVFGFALVLLAGSSMYWRDRWGREVRRQAEKKGVALLRFWLTAEQARRWDSSKKFDVVGSDTGTRYRIGFGTAMNVHELDSAGRAVIQWCSAPQGNLVVVRFLPSPPWWQHSLHEKNDRLEPDRHARAKFRSSQGTPVAIRCGCAKISKF